MKKPSTLIIIVTILLSCSEEPNNDSEVQNNWDNGQPKEMVIETTDPSTYYKLELDSLGKITQMTPFINGNKSGTQIYFKDNLEVGALINLKDDEREGYVFEFRPQLYPGFKGLAKNGKFNGESIWYHENGQVRKSGILENGKLISNWTHWDEDGNIVNSKNN